MEACQITICVCLHRCLNLFRTFFSCLFSPTKPIVVHFGLLTELGGKAPQFKLVCCRASGVSRQVPVQSEEKRGEPRIQLIEMRHISGGLGGRRKKKSQGSALCGAVALIWCCFGQLAVDFKVIVRIRILKKGGALGIIVGSFLSHNKQFGKNDIIPPGPFFFWKKSLLQSLIWTALNSCFERLWCDLRHWLHLAGQKVPLLGGRLEFKKGRRVY